MTKKDRELIRLGKLLKDFAEIGLISNRRLLTTSFLKGLMQGFGAVIGGTILVTLLLWILSWFNQIPLLGGIVDTVSNTLER